MGTELATNDVYNEFVRLMDAVDKKKPAPADVTALRSYLRKHPEVIDRAGGMLDQAANQIINYLGAGKVSSGREFLEADYSEVKRRAGWENATPLERMLIDAIALAWLTFYVAQQRQAVFLESGGTMRLGEYIDRRVSAAHRRYLQSIEALARVRKLATVTPAVFNIANQQIVNTAEASK